MSKIEDWMPAFPLAVPFEVEGGVATAMSDGMTLRQYAAITLCVPESGEPWLDDMIRKAQRDRFAGQALASMLATPQDVGASTYGTAAELSYSFADAMLEARAPAPDTYKQEFDG